MPDEPHTPQSESTPASGAPAVRPRSPSDRARAIRSPYDTPSRGFSRVIHIARRFAGAIPRGIARGTQSAWHSWSSTKPRKTMHLLQGLPAVLGFGCAIAVAAAVSLNRNDLIPAYKAAAEQAAERKNFREAQLYYRKLLTLDGGSPRTRFDYALVLFDEGERLLVESQDSLESGNETESQQLRRQGTEKLEQARSLIAQVAPADSPGVPEAHVFLARAMLDAPQLYLVDEDGNSLRKEGVRELLHHLSTARNSLPGNPQIPLLYYRYYYGLKQYQEAAKYLEIAAKSLPDLRYELSEIYLRIGDSENASRNLNLAGEFYERLILEHPENHRARARCAAIRLRKGNFGGCLDLLKFGDTIAPPDQNPYPLLLAQSHVAMFDLLVHAQKGPLENQLAHLRAALGYVENHAPAMSRLMKLISVQGEHGEQMELYFQKMISGDRLTGTAHFALGTRAWGRKDSDTARWHYERAYEHDPDLGYVANNLAWVLADSDPPELDRALQIVNRAAERFPTVATYHDTRGHILAKLGEWQSAVEAFETALPKMPRNLPLHESLARCYDNLGQPERAEKLRTDVERLKTEETIRQPEPKQQFQFPSAPADAQSIIPAPDEQTPETPDLNDE